MRSPSPMASQEQVPSAVAALALLDRCSYEDAFGVAVASRRAPGAWARLIVDAAPAPLLRFIHVAQSTLLGLELAPPDASHPLGWTIAREDADMLVLAADGPGGAARIIG